MFSTAATPFSVPASSVGGLQFLLVLADTVFFSLVFIIANLVGVKQYLVVFNFVLFLAHLYTSFGEMSPQKCELLQFSCIHKFFSFVKCAKT